MCIYTYIYIFLGNASELGGLCVFVSVLARSISSVAYAESRMEEER